MIDFARHPDAGPALPLACEQVARWWRDVFNDAIAEGDDPLVLAAAGDATRAHVYPCALPPVGERLGPACSIVLGSASGPDTAYSRSPRIVLSCEARGATTDEAVAMLRSLRRAVRRGEGAFSAPHVGNVIGLPPVAIGGAISAWRFLYVDVLAEPQPLSVSNEAGSTGDGEATAVMTLAARVAPVRVEAAFRLRVTNGTLGDATVDFDGGSLFLGREPEGAPAVAEEVAVAGRSIAEFVAAVNAGVLTHGYIAEQAAAFADETPATALLGFFARTIAVDGSVVVAAIRQGGA